MFQLLINNTFNYAVTMSDVKINKYLVVYLNYNYDFVANIFHFLPSLFTFSSRELFTNDMRRIIAVFCGMSKFVIKIVFLSSLLN